MVIILIYLLQKKCLLLVFFFGGLGVQFKEQIYRKLNARKNNTGLSHYSPPLWYNFHDGGAICYLSTKLGGGGVITGKTQ